MYEAVGRYGRGYEPPSVERLRGSLLDDEVKEVDLIRKKHEGNWELEGCTLMSDGWTDKRGRSIINFLAHSSYGSFYLYSIDASAHQKTAEYIADTLEDAIHRIGPSNVVQVCTDNASNYVKAGAILMEKFENLYWTPCVAHCIDLILEDIGKLPNFKKVIQQGRKITTFIYGHSVLHCAFLNSSSNKELVRCGVTRFATSFLTLQSIKQHKSALSSLNWIDWINVGSGEEVHRSIFSKEFWIGLDDCLKASQPLVVLLRMVDGDGDQCMAHIAHGFEKVNDAIDKHFASKPTLQKNLREIMNKRWIKHFKDKPIFGAGAFLNPKYYYSLKR